MPKRTHTRFEREERWLRTKLTAAARWGLLTRAQLFKLGHNAGDIETMLRQQRLELVERGVYAVPGYREDWRSRLYLHTIKTGGRASHLSAALLWSLDSPDKLRPGFAEVTVAAHLRPQPRSRLKIYGSVLEVATATEVLVAPVAEDRAFLSGLKPWNPDHSTQTQCGIRCTSVVDTLLDIGLVHGEERFLHCYAEAIRLRLTGRNELLLGAQSRMTPRRPGGAKLRTILQNLNRDRDALSGWSYLAANRIEEAGLPRPILEHELFTGDGVRIGQVDLWWPQFKLVVELDGKVGHSSATAFQADRRRDALLAAEGITVLRFTWEQFHDGSYFIGIIARILTSGGFERLAPN